MIESSYTEEDLKKWSLEKLQANIDAAWERVEMGTGDDYLDWESGFFLAGLLWERARRDRI